MDMSLQLALPRLWLIMIVTAGACRGAELEGSFITFLSHRTGRNLLYRMRPDGSASGQEAR
jgi:hypothetical protein